MTQAASRRTAAAAAGGAWPLPVTLTSFVGRGAELAAVQRALEGGARLVSVVGPGGIGKTRLAIELSHAIAREGRRVAFCDLGEARDEEELVSAVADRVGATRGNAAVRTFDQLADRVGAVLGRHGPAVVVLDGMEQLVDHVDVLKRWLASAPSLAVVATTRERLRLTGEHVIDLPPLDVAASDAPPEDLRASDGVRLLVDRARAASARFELRDEDLVATADVVRAVDGIPLAIELCAARLGVLGVSQLLDQLRAGGVLRAGAAPRDATRKGTLRGAIAWSWDLLDASERDALARCSVFRGGWDLDAARGVLELEGPSGRAEALERMQRLHDRSLVRTYDPPGFPGERRFALYEAVREFAAERLAEAGAEARALAAHARHFLGVGAALAEDADGPDGVRARAKIALDADNLAAVARRALASGRPLDGLRALLALEPVRAERGPLDVYTADLAAALDATAAEAEEGARPREIALGLVARGRVDVSRGRFVEAHATFARALDEARRSGDRRLLALARSKHAAIGVFIDAPDARGGLYEATALASRLGDPRLEGICASDLASALSRDGDELAALAHRERAVDRFTLAGDAHRRAIALGYLGSACHSVGRFADAERYTERAVEEIQALGDARSEGQVLGFLGRTRHALGRHADARATLRAALGVVRSVGDRWFIGIISGWIGDLAAEEGRWEDAVESYERAVPLLDAASERPYAALFRAALDVARVHEGGGLTFAATAPATPDAAPLPITIAAAVELHLVHARLVAAPSDAARAAALAGAAAALDRVRREGSPAPVASYSDDVRFAARLLDRAVEDLDAGGARDEILVGPEARWFERTGVPRVDLERHRGVRLVLLKLVTERLERPGVVVSREALFAAGWPNTRIRADSAQNRLSVSLTRIKRLGLRDVLRTRDDGLLLDPAFPLRFSES